jgi:hypothetical protein
MPDGRKSDNKIMKKNVTYTHIVIILHLFNIYTEEGKARSSLWEPSLWIDMYGILL